MSVRSKGAIADRLAAGVAWCVLAVFVVGAVLLARVNNSPGSSDSCGNLTLARSLVQGRGYVTGGLGELWIKRPLDAPDTVRPPGVPALLAAVFALAGTSLAVPVLVNAATVLVNALALRWAIRRRGGRWAADCALVLVLLSTNYELISIWNNNLLAACVSLLLLVASRADDSPRGLAWLPVLLATIAAVGFLMKQSFLLNALPFGFLVLASDAGKTKARRLLESAGFLGLFLGLTAVYWGRNLVLYGEPLYSPSFASARIAARYGFLPNGPWRTLRFDRPATYGEIVRALGLARMLLTDVKMVAKTLFYTVCMNPAVVLCAAGTVVFWRPARWRDYAEVAALSAGILFEVGIYHHHEFRYLWPMYPCLLLLAWYTLRDFEQWGAAQVTPLLGGRVRTAFALLGASALLIGAIGGLENGRKAYEEACRPTPGWVDAVQALPESSVVLTADVGAVVWWTERRAVVSPLGARADLATVIDAYKTDYYLAFGDESAIPERGVALSDDDLVPVARGRDWGLFRIVGPLLKAKHDSTSRVSPSPSGEGGRGAAG